MQNNFEHDVRQKMDELKLSPSAAVWERVEVEIREEKRKRRGLLWLLPVALLLIGGGLFLYEQPPNRSSAVEGLKVQSPPKANDKRTNVYRYNPADEVRARTEQNASLQPKQKAVMRTARLNKEKPAYVAELFAPAKPSFLARQHNPVSTKPSNEKPLPSAAAVQQNTAPSIQANNLKVWPPASSVDKPSIVKEPSATAMDSIKNKTETKENLSPKTDSVVKAKIASVKKWRKQLTVDAGISGYAEGPFFQAFNSNVRDAFYSALNSSGPIAPTVPTQASKITSGFYFSVGFAAAKRLRKRWELSFGLQYAYASTRQKVGDKKPADTTVQFAMDKSTASGYYTASGNNSYTNRFHFIEVPVSISFKPSLRLPLWLSMGAAYGRIFSTNALTFSSASNLYYQNKENYLRNAALLSAAAQVEFFGKKTSFRTGPFVQYNSIKLRKENGSDTPHLIAAGLRTVIIF